MKVCITGANGFIGRNLCQKLIKQGHIVSTIDHAFLTQYPDKLEEIIKKINPDWIFHLAAFGNMSFQTDEFDIIEANIAGTFNLLEATKDIPYKAFINVSTSSVLLPHQTIYSASKMSAEYLCRAYRDEHNKPIISVRPASVFGVGEAGFRFIPTVFRSCLENEAMVLSPDATHDWIEVNDITDAVIEIAQYEDPEYIYNLSTGIQATNKEVVSIIEDITQHKAIIAEERQLRSFDTYDWHITPNIYVNHTLREGLEKYYESITGKNNLS